jgi:hypothetical protein
MEAGILLFKEANEPDDRRLLQAFWFSIRPSGELCHGFVVRRHLCWQAERLTVLARDAFVAQRQLNGTLGEAVAKIEGRRHQWIDLGGIAERDQVTGRFRRKLVLANLSLSLRYPEASTAYDRT